MATNFNTGYAGLYTGKTVAQLITMVLNRLGQTNHNRYSLQYVMDILDDRQQDFVSRTRVLRGWSLIPMRANVAGYALPKMCLPDGLERARFYSSSDNYDDLDIRDRDYMDNHYPGWLTADSGTPMIIVTGDWFGNVQKIHVYPPPDTAGTTYTTGSNAGVVLGGTDLPTTWNNIAGLASGGSTTTLEDTEVDFTEMGLVEGMAVVKTDTAGGDECVGYILSIAEHTLTFAEVMTNSGTFSEGDAYEIMAGEVGTVTDVSNEDSYLFTSDVGVIGSITIPDNNIMAEFRRYAVSLESSDVDYQKPETPWSWHNHLASGAAGEILEADTQRRSQLDLALAQKLQVKYEQGIAECIAKPTMPSKRKANIVPRIKR